MAITHMFFLMQNAFLTRIEDSALGALRTINRWFHPRRRAGRHVIHAYAGFGKPQRGQLRCRVTLPTGVEVLPSDAPRWLNAWNILRRLVTSEVSGVSVGADLQGHHAKAMTDQDGYAALNLDFEPPLPAGWHELTLSSPGAKDTLAPLLIVDQPEFIVVSDLDDTVIVSNVGSLVGAALTMLMNNVRTRDPFPGVERFYKALSDRQGEDNPIFYLSSSPWNLYDLLWRFLNKQGIVHGPLLLRNWREGVLGHGSHKLTHLRELLSFYRAAPFILIGDSTQEDPEIYAQLVKEQPSRVLAVYIRDVEQSAEVQQRVKALQDELRAQGIPLILSPDTDGMIMHAKAAGHIVI